MNGFGVGVSVADILQNGLNACNFLQLMSAGAGSILGGTGGGAPPPLHYPQLSLGVNSGGTIAIGGAIEVAVPGAILVIPGILDIVGDWARDLGDLLYSEDNSDEDSENTRPPGFNEAEWENFKQQATDFLRNTGLDQLNGELEAHGSMNPDSDLDMLYRVDQATFDELVQSFRNAVSNPTRSAESYLRQNRMTTFILGDRKWGRFNNDQLPFFDFYRDQWLNNFPQYDQYQFSVAPAGSQFDNSQHGSGIFIRIYP